MQIDLDPSPLEDLLNAWSQENVEKLLSTFICEREPDMEKFLTEKAIAYHKRHRSRTYLFLSDDRTKVLAYVTLGIKCLKVSEDNELSNSIRKDIDLYKGISQTYLIGQLCKADGVGKGIGPKLIDFSMGVFGQSFRTIGCRAVRVDCKKELIEFYRENGFHLVSQEEGGDDLYHMVILF